jgi:hypothetical protein
LFYGLQGGRHFSGSYRDYSYLPLHIFGGDILLWAKLPMSGRARADGVVLEQLDSVGKAFANHMLLPIYRDF